MNTSKSGAKCPAFFISALTGLTAIFLITGCLNKEEIRKEVLEEMGSPKPVASSSSSSPLGPPAPDTRPLQTASREALLDRIRLAYGDFKSLKTSSQLTFLNSSSSPQSCQAHITYEKQGKLHVKAYKELVPNFFTLATNEGKFWFEVPRYKTVYTGFLNTVGTHRSFDMQLNPVLLERSLLATPLAADELAEMGTEEPPYYVITIFGRENGLKMLRRKLWIDRRDLTVTRELYFSGQGIPALEVLRKNYTKDAFLSFPQDIEFQKMGEGKKVRMSLKNIPLNSDIPLEKFRYQVPAGYTLEVVT